MYNYIINGGKSLHGEVNISGSKNASLPILAATIISGKTTKLYNVPDIEDVKTTIKILRKLGCKVKEENSSLIINSKNVTENTIPDELMRKLRSSVIISGALLARLKQVRFSYPGGCDIGTRPIDLHLESFKKIGIKINENSSYIECKCDKIITKSIHLDFPSVGATENIILASIIGKGHEVTINNVAMEPEIIDLADFLNKAGAKVYGAGTKVIKIIGVESLKSVSYRIMPDRIETGTFLIATAMTGGNVKLNNVIHEHVMPVISKLRECGAEIVLEKNSMTVISKGRLKAVNIETMPYPGFPTDLQPIFSTFLTICRGTSIVNENIFENRYKYAQELNRMGAKTIVKGNTLIIKGTRKLYGKEVECTDLRGGASLVLAGLIAKGKTKVKKLEYLNRGYENLDKKLNLLGADILREEGD